MVDNLCNGDCMFKSKRERLKSLPVSYECRPPNQLPFEFVRHHRNSEIANYGSTQTSPLREVSSEPYNNSLIPSTDVGVKSYYEWKPRRSSGSQSLASRANDAINVDSIFVERNSDRKFVLSPSEFNDLSYKSGVVSNNPFKSELFLRVLYMIACMNNNDQEPLPSIQDQFLSEEQIRENLLKELRHGVSRLSTDKSHDSTGGKSGTATPVEFIYNKIPGMIRQHSLANLKAEELSHVSSLASMDGHISEAADHCDTGNLSSQLHAHQSRRKGGGKMRGRDNNMFAPVTY